MKKPTKIDKMIFFLDGTWWTVQLRSRRIQGYRKVDKTETIFVLCMENVNIVNSNKNTIILSNPHNLQGYSIHSLW